MSIVLVASFGILETFQQQHSAPSTSSFKIVLLKLFFMVLKWYRFKVKFNGAKTENPLLPGVTKISSMLFFEAINRPNC